MASPPFNPNEASPGDTDVVSLYPGVARTFRDIMESWMIFEHGRSGHHTFPRYTTGARDAVTTWEAGALVYNTTLKQLQMLASADPDVWTNMTEFPTGTRMIFQQTAAPTGWTKVADAAYENAALRNTTGAVSTGGTAAFTTAFDARTILQANLPDIDLTAESDGAHTHDVKYSTGALGGGGATVVTAINSGGSVTGTAGAASGGAHTHNVPLGGSGTAMDFDVKHVDTIVAVKD